MSTMKSKQDVTARADVKHVPWCNLASYIVQQFKVTSLHSFAEPMPRRMPGMRMMASMTSYRTYMGSLVFRSAAFTQLLTQQESVTSASSEYSQHMTMSEHAKCKARF